MLKFLLQERTPINPDHSSKIFNYNKSPIVLNQISSKILSYTLLKLFKVAKAFENLSNNPDSDLLSSRRRCSHLTPCIQWPKSPQNKTKSLKFQIQQSLSMKVTKRPQNRLQNLVRRKSCYCQDCGGISKFEIKTKGVVLDLQK